MQAQKLRVVSFSQSLRKLQPFVATPQQVMVHRVCLFLIWRKESGRKGVSHLVIANNASGATIVSEASPAKEDHINT